MDGGTDVEDSIADGRLKNQFAIRSRLGVFFALLIALSSASTGGIGQGEEGGAGTSSVPYSQSPIPNSQQDVLTLNEAIRLALENNGNARAARRAIDTAEATVTSARSRFFPTITPDFAYTNSRTETDGPFDSSTDDHSLDITARWLLLDTGQRNLNFRQARLSLATAHEDTREILRGIIFQTTRSYYDLLRQAELLRVAEASVERSKTLYEVAKFQADPAIGTAPAKDVFQAEADLANAEVQLIAARNNYEVAGAELKRLIGWERTRPLPNLAEVPVPSPTGQPLMTLEQYWERALAQRPDLRSTGFQVESQRIGVQQARIETGLTFEVNASASQQLDPDHISQRQLTFVASYPLFDAGLTRANLKQARASYDSARSRFEQAKRDAVAEVEQAYLTLTETERRLAASNKAVEAARKNYDAASESLKEGVGDIIDVITAQLALLTAETNAVQAIYDYYIAEMQLRLVVGEPLPEETDE